MDNTTNEDSANIEGVQGEVLESDVNQIVEIEDGPVVVQESADIGERPLNMISLMGKSRIYASTSNSEMF